MTELNSRESDPVPFDVISVPSASSEILSEAVPLEVREFVDESSSEPMQREAYSPSDVPVDGPRCWYCGIGEALGWWFGTLLVHILAGAAMAIVLIVNNVVSGKAQPADIQDPKSMMILTSGEMILFVLAAILAVSLRFWGQLFKELNFSRPDPRHVWMVIAGTLPLTFCVSVWSMPIQWGWEALCEVFPILKFLDGMNTMELVKGMAETTPLWAMIW